MSRARKVLAGVAVAAAALVLLEGAVNTSLFVHDLLTRTSPPIAERRHTRHDPDLGWTNEPGKRLPDLYGPGLGVTIDARGLRDRPTPARDDAVHVACSGDSFTFGYGVGDADTWPAQVTALDPGLATDNLALGGYGLDQCYLRYLRDGLPLEHRVHVVAVIAEDVVRMTSDHFQAYPKPWLDSGGDAAPPTVHGVPVPAGAYESPWAAQNAHVLRRLGLIEAAGRLSGGESASGARPVLTIEQAANVAWDALAHLRAVSEPRGVRLVFVFLPSEEDAAPNGNDLLREPLLAALRGDGFTVVDLVDALRHEDPAAVPRLYLHEGDVAEPSARGHFSVAGNRWVAEHLLPVLREAARPR